jgi:anaerobic magnesium-protoporphyrin IX monomethyl ester cyclase
MAARIPSAQYQTGESSARQLANSKLSLARLHSHYTILSRRNSMHDLALIRESGEFSIDSDMSTRVALIHHSFRSVSVRRGIGRSLFSSHFPALGLLNLAHSLRTDAAKGLLHLPQIRYFDEEAFDDVEELVTEMKIWLEPARRRLIAASSYTATVDHLESFLARFNSKKYLIVVGGAHATTAPELEHVHIVVRGEGGAALRHILQRLFSEGFHKSQEARGLNFVIEGNRVASPPAFDRSIETLPSPGFAFDLLPPESQLNQIYATNFKRMLGRKPMIYICTQSCRSRCTFCSTYLIHGKTVARPIEKVAADLHYLVNIRGFDSIEFHDDDLFQHPDFGPLLKVMQDLDVPWFCYGRAEAITRSDAREMVRSGCKRVFLGLESMNQETLDYFNKQTSVSQNRAAAETLSSAGIDVLAGFIIGAPHHTIEGILAELDEFLALPLLGINVSILSPDPGTVEFKRARRLNSDFQYVAQGTNSKLHLMPDTNKFGTEVPTGLPSVCSNVSKRDLNDLLSLIEIEFYLRDDIQNRLCLGLSPDQMQVIDEFLAYQQLQVKELYAKMLAGNLHPLIAKRVEMVGKGQCSQ